jgi:putative PIN family toxin of toxin-antitoxin system
VKVYLDTNVLVSAFATRGLCSDVLHVVLAEHQLLVGDAVLTEVRRVLRQKIRLTSGAVAEVELLLRQQGLVIGATMPLKLKLRDKDDLAILAEALTGSADVLVSGDRDLLDLGKMAPLPIVTPRGFWELLRATPEAT